MRWDPLLAAVLLTANAVARQPLPVSSLPAGQLQRQVLRLVNQARARGASCGKEHFGPAAPLAISDKLYRAARLHADDMAAGSYFEHAGRDGSTPKERALRQGYRLRLIGENIAYGPDSAAEVVRGWLGSAGHCANLLDPRFRQMGVAVALGNRPGHFYWSQELGEPAPG